MSSCSSDNNDDPSTQLNALCSTEELEVEMDELLALTVSEVNFSFTVKRQDERQYTYNKGDASLQTSYESASTSKLVAAVVILRLVEAGYLSLTDKPQDYISSWSISSTDPLYNLNLTQLLSFTSGLEVEPFCLNLGSSNFETCVNNIATRNADNGITPGQSFYYGGAHLQVAGLMAVKAFDVTSWQDVFLDFKTQTGLFLNSEFDLPSSSNPRLAGGMHWSGEEYIAFLSALKNGDLLNSNSMAILLADHTEGVSISYSPIVSSFLMEDWRYGFGLWHECESSVFDCEVGTRVSSPGAYGAYPYWDKNIGYVGLVARQGELGTFESGLMIERGVRETVELWAQCQ